MSTRNKIIWSTTAVLAVLTLLLAGVLLWKDKKESVRTQADISQKTKQDIEKKEPDTTASLEETQEPEKNKASLIFTGDVLLSHYVLNNYNAFGIEGVLDDGMLQALKESDVTIINQEFPFSTRGTQAEDKQFTFRVDPAYVSVLKEMGADMAAIANNHILDYGDEALLDTMDTLDEAGILYAGAGKDKERAAQLQVMEAGGLRIGMLAASRVIPVAEWNIDNHQPGVFCTYDPASLLARIRESKKECDYLFVYVHWGIERNTMPEEYQKNMARQYIDAGADAVIGSHPHVLQGIEFYKEKPIFYSLGNFIFNQEIAQTMAVQLEVEKGKTTAVRILPASASGAKTSLAEGEQAQQIYRSVEAVSDGIRIDEEGSVSKIVEQ